MGAIAAAGDGTLAQIESPQQLADLYASELQGLASTLGRKVSLGIRTRNGAELLDVLNDLPRTSAGNFQLPNLRYGQELSVGLRLQLPAWTPNQEIATVRLAWDSPEADGRQQRIETLTLPVLLQRDLDGLDADLQVAEQLALLQANRQRRQAIEELDRGDLQSALASIAGIDMQLAGLPQSDAVQRERRLLAEKQALMQQDRNLSRKRLRRESLRSSLSVWEGRDDQA
jgi:Ca-activated chloride channel family protein